MDPSWIHYRRATFAAWQYFRGDKELEELKSQVLASLESLGRWATPDNESLVSLKEWLRQVVSCESGEQLEVQFCYWILFQPLGMPGKDLEWRA